MKPLRACQRIKNISQYQKVSHIEGYSAAKECAPDVGLAAEKKAKRSLRLWKNQHTGTHKR